MEASQMVTITPRQRLTVKAKNLFDIVFRVAKQWGDELEKSNIDTSISIFPPYREPRYSDGITLIKIKEVVVKWHTDEDGDTGIVSGNDCTSATIRIQPITDGTTNITITRFDPPQEPDRFDQIEKDECPVFIRVGRTESFDRVQFLNDFARRILEEATELPTTQAAKRQSSVPQVATKQRSARIIAALLFLLGVSVALVTNVASNTLPKEWEPYLWLSWPLLLVLVVISLILVFRQY